MAFRRRHKITRDFQRTTNISVLPEREKTGCVIRVEAGYRQAVTVEGTHLLESGHNEVMHS